jgi:hypothetical protein
VIFLAPDPGAMLEAISEDPAAIGFIPRRWLEEIVSSVTITDVEDEELRQPILALSEQSRREIAGRGCCACRSG